MCSVLSRCANFHLGIGTLGGLFEHTLRSCVMPNHDTLMADAETPHISRSPGQTRNGGISEASTVVAELLSNTLAVL